VCWDTKPVITPGGRLGDQPQSLQGITRGPRRSNAPGLPDEIYFSIVQRKVATPNDFTNLDQVQDRLTAFEQRYNATARPLNRPRSSGDRTN
jgi:hypothetical protein